MAGRAHESTAVFVNADVVTMDERHPFAEAVAVRSGRILAVGELGRVLAAAGRGARLVDLGGGTLVPGFVDGHGHFTQVASELDWVDLSPPPAGSTAVDRGYGRAAARAACTGSPPSTSTSWASATTTRCSRSGATRPRKTWIASPRAPGLGGPRLAPDGGRKQRGARSGGHRRGHARSGWRAGGRGIVRRPGSREPTGLLQRRRLGARPADVVPAVPDHHHPDLMRRTGEHYARLGITTAHDGATDVGAMKMLHAAADDGSLPIDVVSYPLYQLEPTLARRGRALPAGLPGRRARRRREDRSRRLAAGQERLADRAVPGRAAGRAARPMAERRCSRTTTSTASWPTASRAACTCSRTRTAMPPSNR